jgi:hypothetical protein
MGKKLPDGVVVLQFYFQQWVGFGPGLDFHVVGGGEGVVGDVAGV